MLTFKNVYYLPLGRIFSFATSDGYIIESTEMRTVKQDGLMMDNPSDVWKHIVDFKEKWIIDLSTQKGCPYHCKFCDVPYNKFKGNLTSDEILQQLINVLSYSSYVTESKSLLVHFARMGEPFHNIENVKNVILDMSNYIPENLIYTPVINTILPKKIKSKSGFDIMDDILGIKKSLDGNLDINISCSSTDEKYRKFILTDSNYYLLTEIINYLNYADIIGNKVKLNFIITDGYDLDFTLFEKINVDKIGVRLTPVTTTCNSISNNIKTGNLSQLNDILLKMGIDSHILYTPLSKTHGLGCGQLVTEHNI